MSSDKRRSPIRQYLFLEQNSLYLCQKPRKATALLHFWLQYKKFSILTKLRSTLKCEIIVQEKAKTTDNADAYRWFLTRYCAISSHFKEILPYGVSAKCSVLFSFWLFCILDAEVCVSLCQRLCYIPPKTSCTICIKTQLTMEFFYIIIFIISYIGLIYVLEGSLNG